MELRTFETEPLGDSPRKPNLHRGSLEKTGFAEPGRHARQRVAHLAYEGRIERYILSILLSKIGRGDVEGMLDQTKRKPNPKEPY